MSEEEIIDEIKYNILNDPFIVFSQDSSFEDVQIKANAIQGLLDLYQKEKEKNKEFLNKLENSLDFARTSQDIISTTQADLLERIIKEFRELLEERN